MALVTHQIQGSYAPSRPILRRTTMELNHFLPAFPSLKTIDRLTFLKARSCLCVRTPILKSKKKPLNITSFKGSIQNDDSRASRPKSVKISIVPQESEEPLTKSPKIRNDAHVSCTPEAKETIMASRAIHNLFKSWLTLLHRPLPNQVVEGALVDLSPQEIPETQTVAQESPRANIFKAACCTFLGVDASIKIPFMIFIPIYLAVNMIYGAQVSRELIPLWILGPLFVALYVKVVRVIWSLYVFSFNLTLRFVKNLPVYYDAVYECVGHGKLKEIIQLLVGTRNLDFKEASKVKLKELEGWMVEKNLDFLESIWPFYRNTIRFMKRAHFI